MRYKVIRVPASAGVDWLPVLTQAVSEEIANGWTPTGAPFYDGAMLMGCQALYRAEQAPAGEVRLREPRKSR